jgi:hypothetical protein
MSPQFRIPEMHERWTMRSMLGREILERSWNLDQSTSYVTLTREARALLQFAFV